MTISSWDCSSLATYALPISQTLTYAYTFSRILALMFK